MLILDEATTGVDKLMWQAIREEARGCATVYTTQSIDEAEAISDKLAIMVKGLFKCYGTVDEIKLEHGSGFDVQVTLNEERIPDYSEQPLLLTDEE